MKVHELAQVSEEKRNPQWENEFLKALTESSVKILSADPQYGPDGWPYLFVETVTESSSATLEPAQKILQWLRTRGIGLVVNPQKQMPDYVLTFGMIWSFCKTGYFFRPTATAQESSVMLEPGQKIFSGPPSEEYLPPDVRKILGEFFRDQGLLAPKVLMLSTDGLNYDLAFSVESLKNPPEQEHAGIAEAISWFLPPHYSVMLISEKGLPAFTAL